MLAEVRDARAPDGGRDQQDRPDRRARRLIPIAEECARELPEAEIVPVSALTGENVDELVAHAQADAAGGPGADAGGSIHRPDRAHAGRGNHPREDLPRDAPGNSVFDRGRRSKQFTEDEERKLVRIAATIIVDRDSHKGMMIGAGGRMLKQIGTAARLELEEILGWRVFLELHVKVERNWTRDPRKLARWGCRAMPRAAKSGMRSRRQSRPRSRRDFRRWCWSGAPTPANRRCSIESQARRARSPARFPAPRAI